jgi:transcription antitermination factor NusG
MTNIVTADDLAELKRLAELVPSADENRCVHDPEGRYLHFKDEVIRLFSDDVGMAKAFAAEVERLESFKTAYTEWSEKTDWARSGSTASEWGKHLADVIKERFDALKAENTALRATNNTVECRFEVSEDTLKVIRGCLRSAEGDIDRLREENEALRVQLLEAK